MHQVRRGEEEGGERRLERRGEKRRGEEKREEENRDEEREEKRVDDSLLMPCSAFQLNSMSLYSRMYIFLCVHACMYVRIYISLRAYVRKNV